MRLSAQKGAVSWQIVHVGGGQSAERLDPRLF